MIKAIAHFLPFLIGAYFLARGWAIPTGLPEYRKAALVEYVFALLFILLGVAVYLTGTWIEGIKQ